MSSGLRRLHGVREANVLMTYMPAEGTAVPCAMLIRLQLQSRPLLRMYGVAYENAHSQIPTCVHTAQQCCVLVGS